MSVTATLIPETADGRRVRAPRAPKRSVSPRKRVVNALLAAAAIVVFVMSIIPVYWMINTSFLPNNLVRGPVPRFFPVEPTLRNYETVMFGDARSSFFTALGNSLGVTAITIVVALVFAFLASIALARFRFRGRFTFIIAVLIVQMIPAEAMIVSTFRLLEGWQLLNSIIGLSIVYIAGVLPFTIWTLRGFVNGVPIELEEAAMIDGCSRTGAFWRITFPLLAPGLVATGVFAFIHAWNEFVFALVAMSNASAHTLPIWLQSFQQVNTTTNWAAIMAASTLIAVPVVGFFLVVQGRMANGMVSGAVKG
ncbi:carbohydrate ABC transporter permease [Homoserinibacter sp. YIM 151385]|uniref:carbohydrate ABC transporter permease n=1 Tax=Homoserinibacter sp. YIM 151385 TaxID=2985506 RepID=UPI0022EFE82E|nr:carbohydrate ABC transporter permease [Homoserinibacter sp. YIM 151385]WBU36772.1 carbohydrate ABC transporter permease [Homoserinibacter sp. YIM 151385]